MIVNKEYCLVQGQECLSACLGSYLDYLHQDFTRNEMVIVWKGFTIFLTQIKIIGILFYDVNFKLMRKCGVS